MSAVRSVENLYVIATIRNQSFAVPVRWVREMIPIPHVTPLPENEPFIRGVVNLRGSTMLAVDMRVRMGMASCIAEGREYAEMLNLREQDHRRWLQELEDSVKERRPFGLARDPHKCAFGKWYYGQRLENSSARCMALDHLLIRFEGPHSRIHAVADQVLSLADSGHYEDALEWIEKARNGVLSELIALFEEARIAVGERRRELAVVIADGATKAALVVDGVDTVEMLARDASVNVNDLNLGVPDGLCAAVGRRQKDDSMVLILDVGEFLRAESEICMPGATMLPK